MSLLSSWINSDGWGTLRDKVNAIITAVNALAGGGTNQVLSKSGTADFAFAWVDQPIITTVVPDSHNSSWSGSQALNTTYTTVGTTSYTTPNDGISRKYLIIGEVTASVSSGAGDNVVDSKIINTTDSVDLKLDELAFPDVQAGSGAKIQGTMVYIGTIAPNKTIAVQSKKTTSNGVSIIAGSLTMLEISR